MEPGATLPPGLGPGCGPWQLPGPLRALWGQARAHLLPVGHPRLLPAAPLGASSRVGHAAGYREPDEGRRESCSL